MGSLIDDSLVEVVTNGFLVVVEVDTPGGFVTVDVDTDEAVDVGEDDGWLVGPVGGGSESRFLPVR